MGVVLGAGNLFLLPVTCAAATADTENLPLFILDEVVVTATREPAQNAAVPATVSVVTRKDIETKHYQTVGEALKSVPGVTIPSCSVTGANYATNRLYVNGSSSIVVLVDGQRENLNGNPFSLFEPGEYSNLDNVERIEVLKGSASTLYGSDAVGGVINIITRKPEAGKSKTSLTSIWGSAGTQTYRFYNSGRTPAGFYWTAAAQKEKMGNYDDGAGNTVFNRLDGETYDVKLGKAWQDKADVTLSLHRYLLDYGFPDIGYRFYDQAYYTGKMGTGSKDETRYAARFNYKFTDQLQNTLSMYTRDYNLDDRNNNPATRWQMQENNWGLSDQLTWKTGVHKLTGGYDYYRDTLDKYQDSTTRFNDKAISNNAFFLLDEMQLGPWSLTPGVRVNHNSEYGHNTCFSGAVSYAFNDLTSAYVSYQEFFRAPSLYEVYGGYGSQDLEPEKGKTKELGLNTKLDNKTTVTARLFQTDADNMISFDRAHYRYYNVGSERTRGWNLQLEKKFDEHLSLRAGYTHLAIDAASAKVNENRNGVIPKGVYNFDLLYQQRKFSGSLTARGVIDRPGYKQYENQVSDSFKTFWLMDAAVNYRPVKNMNLFLKVNNIFDRLYTEVPYDMRTPGGDRWYSQPGRFFLTGVQFTF
jgi:vitamin B12 transporter